MLKRSFFKIRWLLGIGLVLVLGFFLFLASSWGQSLLRNEIRKSLASNYSLAIDYRSLRMWPGSAGLVISLRDLQLAYIPMLPNASGLSDPIDSVKISLNPLLLIRGQQAVSRVEVKSAKLSIALHDKKIQLNGLQRSFSPDDLSALLAKFLEPSKEETKKLPRIILEDMSLALSFSGKELASVEPSEALLRFDLSTNSEGKLEMLDLKSKEFDVIKFLSSADEFIQDMKGVEAYLSQRSWIELFDQGLLKDLSLHCVDGPNCEGQASVIGLKTNQEGWIPGVDSLDAELAWKDKVLSIVAQDSLKKLKWQKLYAETLRLVTHKLKVQISFLEKSLQIQVPETELDYNDVHVSVSADINIPWDKARDTTLRYDAEATATDWQKVLAVLPDAVIGDATMGWLSTNLKKATIPRVQSQGRGFARDYQNVGDVPGYFNISAPIEDVSLVYLKDWPLLEACSGQFGMRNLSIGITKLQCKSMQVDVSAGSVVFPNLTASPPHIVIGFEAKAPYEPSLAYLKASPLLSVAKVLDTLGVKSVTQTTKIQIDAPLGKADDKNKLSVEGQTVADKATIVTPVGLYEGKSERIDVSYDQSGLKALDGQMESPFEKSKLSIRRSSEADGLAIQLLPLAPSPDSLIASAFLSPASAPSLIRGTAKRMKLKDLSAIADVESLDWTLGDESLLKVKGKGEIRDLGVASQVFAVPDVLSKGEGDVSFDLSLSQLGKQPVLNSISGSVRVNAKNGAIDRLPTWAVTAVNAANLESFKVGDRLPYEELKADLNFSQGNLSVKDSSLNAGVIEVMTFGNVDFAKDKMNLSLRFVPDLGSAPTALAIGIWNPFVGAALFGVSQFDDRASDSFLNRLASQTYKLEGSPKDPSVKLIKLLDFKDTIR